MLLIFSGSQQRGSAQLLWASAARGRVGPQSGLLTAGALPRPPSGPQEGVSHGEREGSGEKRQNRCIYIARGLQLRGGSGPVRGGTGTGPAAGPQHTSCGQVRGTRAPVPGCAPSKYISVRAERPRYEGTDRVTKRWRHRTLTTREKLPGRPREAPAPGHSPARRTRPAPVASPRRRSESCGAAGFLTQRKISPRTPCPSLGAPASRAAAARSPCKSPGAAGSAEWPQHSPHHSGARLVPGETL